MKRTSAALLFGLLGCLCGCSTPKSLVEPRERKCYVDGYKVGTDKCRLCELSATLDLDECVEGAVMTARGFGGKSGIVSSFAVKPIVEREFTAMIESNFGRPDGVNIPTVKICVESRRILVSRSWSKVTCEMEFAVAVRNRHRADNPLFRKRFSYVSEAVTKNKDEVPPCVYSCIQHVVLQFAEEIASDIPLQDQMISLQKSKER